jgi:UDP-N-acetyl-D-mannosaminuronate dehydrogenase
VADVSDPRILCLGATYKADTYDLRESPAIRITELLKEDGYVVRLADPITREYSCPDLAEAASGCDLLVVLVPHRTAMKELRSRLDAIKRVMRSPRIVDVSGGELVEVTTAP